MIPQTLLVSAFTYGLTALLKWHPSIPLNEGQTAKIRTVASVIALVSSAVVELSQNGFNLQEFAQAHSVVSTVSVWLAGWLVAHLVHKGANFISTE